MVEPSVWLSFLVHFVLAQYERGRFTLLCYSYRRFQVFVVFSLHATAPRYSGHSVSQRSTKTPFVPVAMHTKRYHRARMLYSSIPQPLSFLSAVTFHSTTAFWSLRCSALDEVPFMPVAMHTKRYNNYVLGTRYHNYLDAIQRHCVLCAHKSCRLHLSDTLAADFTFIFLQYHLSLVVASRN